MTNNASLRVLIVGAGHMGISHARAYGKLDGFEICGVVTRSLTSSQSMLDELGPFPQFTDFEAALRESAPDAVSISSYTETHHPFTMAALEAGCHVFVEKPLAPQRRADLLSTHRAVVSCASMVADHGRLNWSDR